MKKLATLAAGIMLAILVSSGCSKANNLSTTEGGIQFKQGSWDEALALAKKENKPIFIDISTSWCHYCKKMKAKVFTDQDVAVFYNAKFINVSVDAENGEGITLAKKYGVRGYPTFVFLKSDGSFTTQESGYHNPEEFIELGKSVL